MLSSTIWILATFGVSLLGASESDYDEYGGWSLIKGEKTGYFHTQNIDGVWWVIDPLGNAFISKGVNHISFNADNSPALGYSPYGRVTEEKYGDAQTWAKQAIQNLWGWGFNTVGAWSSSETFSQKMPYTVIMGIGTSAGGSWLGGGFPDVFSDEFGIIAGQKAQNLCSSKADDPYLLGYFIDNELRWGPDWRSSDTLFDTFLKAPEDSPGKKALVDILKSIYGDIGSLNAAWETKCNSFDDILKIESVADLGVDMIDDDSQPAKPLMLPKGLTKTYLQQIHGDIDKVNAKFGTNAESFDELLTPEFIASVTEEIKGKMPRNVSMMGLKMFYGNIDKANEAFGTDAESFDALIDMFLGKQILSPVEIEIKKVQSKFLEAVARQYFKVCNEAIKAADPNHMILGCRYAGYAPVEVVRGMKGYIDVVSYNNYDKQPPKAKLAEIYEIVECPMMITEFSFKAMDSGLPNTRGAGSPVDAQEDRARLFEQYVTEFMKLPYATGFHWFEYCDEPAEGRFDGENSNYGVINIKDEPWEILVKKMTEVNNKIEVIHQGDNADS